MMDGEDDGVVCLNAESERDFSMHDWWCRVLLVPAHLNLISCLCHGCGCRFRYQVICLPSEFLVNLASSSQFSISSSEFHAAMFCSKIRNGVLHSRGEPVTASRIRKPRRGRSGPPFDQCSILKRRYGAHSMLVSDRAFSIFQSRSPSRLQIYAPPEPRVQFHLQAFHLFLDGRQPFLRRGNLLVDLRG